MKFHAHYLGLKQLESELRVSSIVRIRVIYCFHSFVVHRKLIREKPVVSFPRMDTASTAMHVLVHSVHTRGLEALKQVFKVFIKCASSEKT